MRYSWMLLCLYGCGAEPLDASVDDSGQDELQEVRLTKLVDPTGAGTVTVSPNKSTYHVGDTVKLTAKANSGYTFSGWTEGVTGATNSVSIALEDDLSVEASFAKASSSAILEIVNDLSDDDDGDDDWSRLNTLVRLRVGTSVEAVRDHGEGELLVDDTSTCSPASIAVGSSRSFEVGDAAPSYAVYVETGSWEYDPFFTGCWDLYLTAVHDCGGDCCTPKSAITEITGHTSGKKTIKLSTLLPATTWKGSELCE